MLTSSIITIVRYIYEGFLPRDKVYNGHRLFPIEIIISFLSVINNFTEDEAC